MSFIIDCAHYSENGFEEDESGFVAPKCACGWKCYPCPDIETACDALMQHAYEAGILTARRAAVPEGDTSDNTGEEQG